MEQTAALRQVTKTHNGMRLTASQTTLSADGNHRWTGTLVRVGSSTVQEFTFIESDPTPSSAPHPEVIEFARFCAEVSRARI